MKHLLYPEIHRHHVQGDILKMLAQIIRKSQHPVHLFKVKFMLVLLLMSAQMRWPRIRQLKLIRAMQTQG